MFVIRLINGREVHETKPTTVKNGGELAELLLIQIGDSNDFPIH